MVPSPHAHSQEMIVDSCNCCGGDKMQMAGYNKACASCGAVYDANTGKQITLQSADVEDAAETKAEGGVEE